MVVVEQAVFTSATTDRMAGYQIAGVSPGICEPDLKELAVWGPSHDSLLDARPEAASVNFHPLPSGAYCVSRTVTAGLEPSGRGPRIYSQCLVAGPEAVSWFGNNPFALLKAAAAAGMLDTYAQVPDRLPPLELADRVAAIDQGLLAALAADPGPRWIGTLVQAALDSICLAIAAPEAERLIAGLISCLPPECRGEFSFTTGLRFSMQRPFRIVAFPGPATELRAYQHRYNLTVVDLSAQAPAEFAPLDGWAKLVERTLSAGRTSFLATQLSKRRFDLKLSDLPALGVQLLEDLDATALRGEPAEKASPQAAKSDASLRQAHAPHRGQPAGACQPAAAAVAEIAPPSRQLHPEAPEVLDKLERLDDAVFEAIGGKTEALETLRRLWPQVRLELGEDMLAESREQYLRYALSIWEECVGSAGIRNPAKAVHAIDVLCVLFDRL